jgi:hypothetical protein
MSTHSIRASCEGHAAPRTAAALAKCENLPADVTMEGLTAADLTPDRLRALGVVGAEH